MFSFSFQNSVNLIFPSFEPTKIPKPSKPMTSTVEPMTPTSSVIDVDVMEHEIIEEWVGQKINDLQFELEDYQDFDHMTNEKTSTISTTTRSMMTTSFRESLFFAQYQVESLMSFLEL